LAQTVAMMYLLLVASGCQYIHLPQAQVGTPLTHRHFLRRAMGTYGPGIKAGQGTFPGPKTPIPGEDAASTCFTLTRSTLVHRLKPPWCIYTVVIKCDTLPCRPARLWRQHFSRWQLRTAVLSCCPCTYHRAPLPMHRTAHQLSQVIKARGASQVLGCQQSRPRGQWQQTAWCLPLLTGGAIFRPDLYCFLCIA
jgi:hypothetical protein